MLFTGKFILVPADETFGVQGSLIKIVFDYVVALAIFYRCANAAVSLLQTVRNSTDLSKPAQYTLIHPKCTNKQTNAHVLSQCIVVAILNVCEHLIPGLSLLYLLSILIMTNFNIFFPFEWLWSLCLSDLLSDNVSAGYI